MIKWYNIKQEILKYLPQAINQTGDISMKYCTAKGCHRQSRARGLCMMHYMQSRVKEPDIYHRKDTTYEQRFWNNIEITDYCWLWHGNILNREYGSFKVNGEFNLAHRYSYEYFIGKIKKGLVIDHLCQNKPCVNPYHLEMVTQRENNRRYWDKEDYTNEL